MRRRLALIAILFLVIAIAAGIYLKNIQTHRLASGDKKWIALNGWIVNAETTEGATLALQYAFVGINEEKQNSIISSIHNNSLKMNAYSVNASRDPRTHTDVYDITFVTIPQKSITNSPIQVLVATSSWKKIFDYGIADINIVPKSVNWLTETISSAGTQGLFTTDHTFVCTLKNDGSSPVYIKSIVQAGNFRVTRSGFVLGSVLQNELKTSALQPIPSYGIRINPGKSITLCEQLTTPKLYRNVFFQPGLKLEKNGRTQIQVLMPVEWTELFTPSIASDPPPQYIVF